MDDFLDVRRGDRLTMEQIAYAERFYRDLGLTRPEIDSRFISHYSKES